MEDEKLPFRRIPVSEGTGIYGFFVEVVSLDMEDKLQKQSRYFLSLNMICVSVRNRGESRGTWQAIAYSDYDEAKKNMAMQLESVVNYANENGRAVMTDVPVLVELRDTDVAKILAGELPLARNTATLSVESRNGKISDSSDFSLPEWIWETSR